MVSLRSLTSTCTACASNATMSGRPSPVTSATTMRPGVSVKTVGVNVPSALPNRIMTEPALSMLADPLITISGCPSALTSAIAIPPESSRIG